MEGRRLPMSPATPPLHRRYLGPRPHHRAGGGAGGRVRGERHRLSAGEREVEHAFRTADRAADLAEVSREFQGMLIQTRVRTRDFAWRSERGADPGIRRRL